MRRFSLFALCLIAFNWLCPGSPQIEITASSKDYKSTVRASVDIGDGYSVALTIETILYGLPQPPIQAQCSFLDFIVFAYSALKNDQQVKQFNQCMPVCSFLCSSNTTVKNRFQSIVRMLEEICVIDGFNEGQKRYKLINPWVKVRFKKRMINIWNDSFVNKTFDQYFDDSPSFQLLDTCKCLVIDEWSENLVNFLTDLDDFKSQHDVQEQPDLEMMLPDMFAVSSKFTPCDNATKCIINIVFSDGTKREFTGTLPMNANGSNNYPEFKLKIVDPAHGGQIFYGRFSFLYFMIFAYLFLSADRDKNPIYDSSGFNELMGVEGFMRFIKHNKAVALAKFRGIASGLEKVAIVSDNTLSYRLSNEEFATRLKYRMQNAWDYCDLGDLVDGSGSSFKIKCLAVNPLTTNAAGLVGINSDYASFKFLTGIDAEPVAPQQPVQSPVVYSDSEFPGKVVLSSGEMPIQGQTGTITRFIVEIQAFPKHVGGEFFISFNPNLVTDSSQEGFMNFAEKVWSYLIIIMLRSNDESESRVAFQSLRVKLLSQQGDIERKDMIQFLGQIVNAIKSKRKLALVRVSDRQKYGSITEFYAVTHSAVQRSGTQATTVYKLTDEQISNLEQRFQVLQNEAGIQFTQAQNLEDNFDPYILDFNDIGDLKFMLVADELNNNTKIALRAKRIFKNLEKKLLEEDYRDRKDMIQLLGQIVNAIKSKRRLSLAIISDRQKYGRITRFNISEKSIVKSSLSQDPEATISDELTNQQITDLELRFQVLQNKAGIQFTQAQNPEDNFDPYIFGNDTGDLFGNDTGDFQFVLVADKLSWKMRIKLRIKEFSKRIRTSIKNFAKRVRKGSFNILEVMARCILYDYTTWKGILMKVSIASYVLFIGWLLCELPGTIIFLAIISCIYISNRARIRNAYAMAAGI